MATIPNTG